MTYNTTIGHPLGERILVEAPPIKDKTDGGLHIPQMAQEHARKGINKGRLLDAGLVARDKMVSAGWRFGDELTWGMFSPVYLEYRDDKNVSHEALALNFDDIFTNIDLAKRLDKGDQTIDLRVVDGRPYHTISTPGANGTQTPKAGEHAPAKESRTHAASQ